MTNPSLRGKLTKLVLLARLMAVVAIFGDDKFFEKRRTGCSLKNWTEKEFCVG